MQQDTCKPMLQPVDRALRTMSSLEVGITGFLGERTRAETANRRSKEESTQMERVREAKQNFWWEQKPSLPPWGVWTLSNDRPLKITGVPSTLRLWQSTQMNPVSPHSLEGVSPLKQTPRCGANLKDISQPLSGTCHSDNHGKQGHDTDLPLLLPTQTLDHTRNKHDKHIKSISPQNASAKLFK